MDQKKVLFITGTRADFGKQKSLMLKIKDSPQYVCNIFVTGMHMLERYGATYKEVQKCGFENIFIYINQVQNSSSDMDIVLANTINGLAHYIREFRPDIIIVHGDRIEAIAGAIVGALNNILVAHIEGGELSGTIDELIRHSVTKLAHVHFVSNADAKKRLVQMGEDPQTIYVIGSPDLDILLSSNLPTMGEVRARYNIEFESYGIFCYHPVTTEVEVLGEQIREIKAALIESGLEYVVIYPNNDRGSDIILRELMPLARNPKIKLFPSIRFEYYLTLIKNAKFIMGNSSAGIHEAPVYGVPTINIGSRQNNRFIHDTIVNVNPEKDKLMQVIKSIGGRSKPCFHFGKGNSAELFLSILGQENIWEVSPQKKFRDLSINFSS